MHPLIYELPGKFSLDHYKLLPVVVKTRQLIYSVCQYRSNRHCLTDIFNLSLETRYETRFELQAFPVY